MRKLLTLGLTSLFIVVAGCQDTNTTGPLTGPSFYEGGDDDDNDAGFNFPDFSSIAGFTLNGNAAQSGSVLRLTPASTIQRGSAWFNTKQEVDDEFTTTFDFQITNSGGFFGCCFGGADGFAFVLQNSNAGTTALGGAGGSLGYSNSSSGNAIENSVVVEFDTFNNGPTSLDDQNSDNHIGVYALTSVNDVPTSSNRLGFTTLTTPDLNDGSSHTVRIDYDDDAGTLSIFLDGTLVLTVSVDLEATLGEEAFVGFTSGTGAGVGDHDILNWSFGDDDNDDDGNDDDS